MRFERTGSIDDLNRAIENAEQAVALTPTGLNRAMYLDSLGHALYRRFTRSSCEINAITNPRRALYLLGLGVHCRFNVKLRLYGWP